MSTKFHIGDCETVLPTYPEESMDLIVTSPPYNRDFNYGEGFSDAKEHQEYLHFLFTKFYEVFRVLKSGHWLFLNFADSSKYPYASSDIVMLMRSIGFELKQEIIWAKSIAYEKDNQYYYNGRLVGTTSKEMLAPTYEKILAFVKPDKKVFPLQKKRIGVPLADKSNLKRFDMEEDLRDAGAVWVIPQPAYGRKKDMPHPAPFPEELASRCIKIASNEGDIILDPFMGKGTTVFVAEKLGRNGIGIDLFNFLPKRSGIL